MYALTSRSPLKDQLAQSALSVNTARQQLYDVRIRNVARIVHDALPDTVWLNVETNDVPGDLLLHMVGDDASIDNGNEVRVRGAEMPTELATYRTSDGVAWSDVVRYVERALSTALGTDEPGTRWETDHGDPSFYYVHLPALDTDPEIGVPRPRHLAAYLADRDALPGNGFWHATPVAHPTMWVAGVAITASLDDSVLTVDVDPAVTPPTGTAPAGTDIAVRLRLASSATPTTLLSAGPSTVQDTSTGVETETERERCRTEDCDGDPDDGEGWVGFCGNCADRQYARDNADDVTPRPARIPGVPATSVGDLEYLLGWFAGDGDMRYGRDVEDGQHDNGRRAGFATTAVLAYARGTGLLSLRNNEDPETAIGDLLVDLRHLTDALGLCFADLNRRAEGNYTAELRGEH